jgi:demethylmenaquinone methyltransferase/2-methoxy-6-polyprenyl-1,4-benzoquinol methylase
VRRAEKVRRLFSDIASYYDTLNTIISLGQHRRWRRKAVEVAGFDRGRFLDVGCGTGDFCFELKRIEKRVFGVDFSKRMLDIAKGRLPDIPFQLADVHNLPFRDNTFSGITAGFLIRHIDLSLFLKEANRVLADGGKLVILETSFPSSRLIRWLHRIYLIHLIPLIGQVFGKRDAYSYLGASFSLYMPSLSELRNLLAKAGFSKVEILPLAFGAVLLCVATK